MSSSWLSWDDTEIVLDIQQTTGAVKQSRQSVRTDTDTLLLIDRGCVAVSDNIAQLTCVTHLELNGNMFTAMPPVLFTMTQIGYLNMTRNFLRCIAPEIGRMSLLRKLFLHRNQISVVPREIGQLRFLERLALDENQIRSLPSEMGQLESLNELFLENNFLTWLPCSMQRLQSATIKLTGNPLDTYGGKVSELSMVFAAMTSIAMLRDEATTMAIGLQDLELPALVTLEIIDAAYPNSIPMFKKWKLITAVKHFHRD